MASPGTNSQVEPSWIDELLEIVEQRVGLDLDIGQQKERLVPWVERRVRTLGLPSAASYAARLALEPGLGEEWETCIRALTNGQTFFFRDPEHFGLVGRILVELERNRKGPIQAWCAATSSGEEPYTLAMLATELGLEIEIRATDLNPNFLTQARLGQYDNWALRNVDEERRARFFQRSGATFAVRDTLRQKITFEQYNLMEINPPRPRRGGRWDLVLCRNVFLYFRPERVEEIVWRISRNLSPDGSLILGSSESLVGMNVPVELQRDGDRTFYRPAVAGGPAPGIAALRRAGHRWHPPLDARHRPAPAPRPPAPPPEQAPEPVEALAPPVPEGDALLPAILAAVEAHDLEAARKALEELEAGEGAVLPGLLRGHVELRSGEFEAALRAYGEAEVVDPFHPEVYLFKGLALRKAQRWTDAEEALRHALFLAPHLSPAAALLVGTYRRLGREKEAEREAARLDKLIASGARTFAFLTPEPFLEWFSLTQASAEDAGPVEA